MNKKIWLAAGVAGILIANPTASVQAEVNVRVGDVRVGIGRPPSFMINTRPTFIYVQDLGFSVAVGSPYDFYYYDNLYYICNDGFWYSSSYYNGPWIGIEIGRLPSILGRHGVADIRRFRDKEYRKHNHKYWEGRDQHREREQREGDNRGERGGEGHESGGGRSR